VKRSTRVDLVSVPDEALRAAPGQGAAWLPEAAARRSLVRDVAPQLFVCIEAPAGRLPRDEPARSAVYGWADEPDPGRVAVAEGTAWSIRVSDEPCPR
jgi:hypothetical protein